ncbi:hypothetical protein I553_8433 [Mycobacterium xenopi 4042]|uniref:Uncharacterized protein n=1 Tax=Mycobacterium xenopi 4042 TaxID=1299334 RepID=X7ZZL8_MYCXE|nr:hypothetical protein I553_8433 [Mycobacterium xenopi 4042]
MAPTWTLGEARAKVVDVRGAHRAASRSPSPERRLHRRRHAGQYVTLAVEINGAGTRAAIRRQCRGAAVSS